MIGEHLVSIEVMLVRGKWTPTGLRMEGNVSYVTLMHKSRMINLTVFKGKSAASQNVSNTSLYEAILV